MPVTRSGFAGRLVELVPGDIVALASCDKVLADLRPRAVKGLRLSRRLAPT